MFGVATKSLGEFVTTEKDTLLNRNNLPTDYYLITDDKPSIKGVKKNEEDELDDYFDFVIIEKEEIQQAVDESIVLKQKQRVEKETAAMQASKSEMISSSIKKKKSEKDSQEPTVKLEDFKIKKLIDKGSFGKVCLVVN